jgi:acid phosphatase (class A)
MAYRKKILPYLGLVFFIVLLRPLMTQAGDQSPFYVGPENLPPSLLPWPPTEGSAEWHKQVQMVIAAQRRIAPSALSQMRDEQKMRLDIITDMMGDDFTRQKKPKTFLLLDHVLADAGLITDLDKKFWKARRPYLVDRRVELLVNPIDSSPSYPSGHTSESRVIAEVLGILYPKRLSTLRARAEVIAWHRVQAGVHDPADLEAGRLLAMLILGALTQNDTFRHDLALAQQETEPND